MSQAKETRKRIEAILANCGWQRDSYGNYKSPSGKLRFHFQPLSVRLERRYQPKAFGTWQPPAEWQNLRSDYYRNIKFTECGRFAVGGLIPKDFNKEPEHA